MVPAHLTALFGAALGVLCLIAASVSCCCAPTHEQVRYGRTSQSVVGVTISAKDFHGRDLNDWGTLQVQVVTMAAPLHQKPAPIDPAHVQLRVDEKAQLVNNEASA